MTTPCGDGREPGTVIRVLRAVLGAVVTAADWVLIGLIRVYQYTLSPMLGQRCKYYPSCSNYAIGAIREHGPVKGVGLAGWRLLRCNPFSYGGYDPVPPRRAHHDCGHDRAGRNVSARV